VDDLIEQARDHAAAVGWLPMDSAHP